MAKKKKRFELTAYKQFVRQRKTALIVSLINVIVLLLLSYFISNQALFTGEDLNQYAWMEWFKNKVGLPKVLEEDKDALFVNVAYDKQLIDRHDDYGMSVGNVDITDRGKICSFLKFLEKANTYKYIFLDVRFEKGYDSQEDSALFSQIKKMRNIVVANHSDIEIIDSTLLSKSALNDYYATITGTNFTRYEYIKNGQTTIPLFAYHELTGNTISRHFLFYTCNHRLCYKSLFVKSPIEDWIEFNEQQTKKYYNLGSDLLENYSDKDIALLTKGKIIVIGDMVEDIHDTYSGVKPGSVITYYAFTALMNGEHFVRYGMLMFLGLIYFVISLSLFETSSIIERIPFIKKSRSKFVHFCVSLLEYSFLLLIVMIALYMLFGIATSIMLPSLYFAFQKTYINFKNKKI
jgi:hypothetical protein